jgi:hypothetical protein
MSRACSLPATLLRVLPLFAVLAWAPAARAGEPAPADWAKRFGTERLTLKAADWKGTIDQLAVALKTRIVAWVPARWESREVQGSPAEVLKTLADATQGKWLALPEALGLFPARVVKGMDFDETEIKAFKAKYFGTTVFKSFRLAYSLTPRQLAILGKGDKLSIAELKEEQKELFRDYFQERVLNGPTLWPRYLKEGRIGLSLHASVDAYWRGTVIERLYQVPRSEWKEYFLWKSRSEKDKKPPATAVSLADKFFGKQRVVIPETCVLELVQLEGLLTPLLLEKCATCEFCVSARIRKQGYVVSKGTWSVPALLTALIEGADLELRSVADVAFLTVSQEKQWLLKNLEDSRECELAWRLLRPIVQALANNPRNELDIWSFEQLLEPRLIPLSQMPPKQQERWLPTWALVSEDIIRKGGPAREAAQAAAVKELRKEIPDMEVYPAAGVQLEFWLDGKLQLSHGLTNLSNYGWLMRRTK